MATRRKSGSQTFSSRLTERWPEMKAPPTTSNTKLYLLGFYPQDELLQAGRGEETVQSSVEKCVGFLLSNRKRESGNGTITSVRSPN